MASKERITRELIRMLRRNGYVTYPNYLIEVAGVTHKLDVLAITTPVPGAEVKLGFIVMDRVVGPSEVERYSTWRDEGGLDKIVIITSGDVSVKAYEIAKRLRVGIARVSEDLGIQQAKDKGKYVIMHVHPRLSRDDALRAIVRVRGRGFLRRHEEIESVLLLFIPFIEFSFKSVIRSPESESIIELETTLTFDAIRGALVIGGDGTIEVLSDRGSYAELSSPMIDVVRILVRDGCSRLSDIALELGVNADRLRQIIELLEERSIVELYSDIVEFRRTLLERGFSISEFVRSKGIEIHYGEPAIKGREVFEIFPYADIERLTDFIEALSTEILSIRLIYYPFYIGLVRKEGHSKSTNIEYEVVDALTGSQARTLTWLLAYIESMFGHPLIYLTKAANV